MAQQVFVVMAQTSQKANSKLQDMARQYGAANFEVLMMVDARAIDRRMLKIISEGEPAQKSYYGLIPPGNE